MPNYRTLALAVSTLSLVLGSAAGAEAQWGPRVGIGYVVNAPNQYVGLSAHVLTRALGGLGLYVDGKLTRPTATEREDFISEWTAQYVDDNFGDLPLGDDEEHLSFNAALMRPVTPELIVYAGAGYTRRQLFVEYLDERRERGLEGFYWVEDPDAEDAGVNVLVGAFFRIGRSVSLQFGFETAPKGATVGATYAVPIGR